MTLDAQQCTDYQERGWFHAGTPFSPEELGEIRDAYDGLLTRSLALRETGKTPFEYSALLHVQSPVLCRYATDARLISTAVDLLGPDVRLYWDQAVSKPSGATSDVPWHQDNGYGEVEPEQFVTMTVALDATAEDNGCLWIQPGSHRDGVRPHEPTDTVFFRGYDGDDPGVAVPQAEGSVLVFSSLTLHRSGPNTSGRPRRSWVIQFCDAATRRRDDGVALDDRLRVAEGGVPLAAPYRDRDLDLAALVKTARRSGWA